MNLSSLLIESKTASEFLQRAEAQLKNSEYGFSYAKFARKAGFSARSYVREVFQGKKTLTVKALPAFAKALGLKKEEREIFRCLLSLENSAFDPSISTASAERALKTRAQSIRRRAERKKLPTLSGSHAPSEHREVWPKIYASLETFSTIQTISTKLNLSPLLIERALEGMKGAGVIGEEKGVITAHGHHVVLEPQLHNDLIRGHFVQTLTEAVSSAKENFGDPEKLYFVSSFGVRRDRIPELKRRLIETMLRFVDEVEDGENEEVVSIAATLL